jgi:hypothetical protein
MAYLQWKDANSAHQFEGALLSAPASQRRDATPASEMQASWGPGRNSRIEEIEQLVQHSVRNRQVEAGLYWVVLNLPNQTSRTLYLGSSELDASLIEATARGAVAHALEYALLH